MLMIINFKLLICECVRTSMDENIVIYRQHIVYRKVSTRYIIVIYRRGEILVNIAKNR